MVDRLCHHRGAAGVAVDQVAGGLAGPEAGHARALRQVAVGGCEVTVDLWRRNLDVEGDP